jgi:chorismate dehydratase
MAGASRPPLRVGRISYLNVEPFFHVFPWPLTEALPPRALGEAVAAGRVDAGPLPLADCLRLDGTIGLLPFGIATRERAQSVFLFSHRPIAELGGARIAVTGETSTSVQLLRLLLAVRYEIAPVRLVPVDAPADAVLLIGDAALRARFGQWPFPHCADVGEEWTAWTGLPCVFAAWAVRSDVGPVARTALATALDEALTAGLGDVPAIARARADVRAWGMSEADVVDYLRGFVYRLGPEEEKAMAEFRRLLGLLES